MKTIAGKSWLASKPLLPKVLAGYVREMDKDIRKEKHKMKRRKSLRPCLICWCKICCKELLGSLRFIRSPIHALFSARLTQVRLWSRLQWREKEKERSLAKLDWCCNCFCTHCYSWQGRLKSGQAAMTLRKALADSLPGFIFYWAAEGAFKCTTADSPYGR